MPTEAKSKDSDLGAYFRPLRGHGKSIFTIVGLAVAGTLIYTLLIPPVWKADATILTVLPSDDFSGGGLGAGSTSLASALSPSAPDPMQVLEGVLTSRESVNLMIRRTGLKRRDLEQKLKTDRRQKQALLTISWEDENRNRALAVVQAGLDGVSMLQHEIGFTTAGLQAKYLEDSVLQQELKLHNSEMALAKYEKSMKAPVDPTNPQSAGAYLKEKKDLQLQLGSVDAELEVARAQAKLIPEMPELPTVIPSTKAFRDKLVDLQYQLNVALTTLGPEAPHVVSLKRTIEVTKQALNTEIQRYLKTVNVNLDPAIATLEAQKLTITYQLKVVDDLAARAPDEAVTVARLAREVAILGEVSTALRTKWEQAKVAAKVDEVKWAVLEKPYIEDLPTNKHYARNPVIGGIFGFLFCLAYFNWKEAKGKRAAVDEVDGTTL